MANVGLQPAEQVAGELRDILAGIVSGEVQWSVFAQRFADALPGSGLALFMIDTRDPLDVGEGASAVEFAGYVDTWKPKA